MDLVGWLKYSTEKLILSFTASNPDVVLKNEIDNVNGELNKTKAITELLNVYRFKYSNKNEIEKLFCYTFL